MAANKGKMSVSEAGRKGGKTTSNKYGHGFYEEIGHMGGKKGGMTTRSRHGHEFYEEIGHKGGQKVRRLIEEGKRRA
ncbi:MAG: KGG domain-containing protein [Candidatus Aquicultorales bacterium]